MSSFDNERKNKRSLDDDSHLTSKRQNLSSDSSKNPFVLKCLVLGDYAGSVIGKHGAVIKKIQAQSGAIVRLSQSNEFFPGTQERIAVLLSKTQQALLIAFSLVLAQQYQVLSDKTGTEQSGDADALQVRLCIPKLASGPLIGKRGTVIKQIIDASGARVRLAQPGETYPGVEERVVTVTGNMTQQLECVRLIFERMQERPESKTYTDTSTNYASRVTQGISGQQSLPPFGALSIAHATGPASHQSRGGMMDRNLGPLPLRSAPPLSSSSLLGGPRYVGQPPMAAGLPMGARRFVGAPRSAPAVLAPRANGFPPQRRDLSPRGLAALRSPPQGRVTTINVAVPDALVPALLGHQDQSIAAMQQYSTATIRIAKHPQLIDGENRRMITITGAAQACQTAQVLLQHKLSTVPLPGNWQ